MPLNAVLARPLREMRFLQCAAAVVMGDIPASGLPEVATKGLEEGYESVALAILAGANAAEKSPYELEDLWHRSLKELGVPVPDKAGAGRILRDFYVDLVARGELPARRGAGEVVRLATELDDVLPSREYAGDGLGIEKLLGLYYSHDDVAWGDGAAHTEIDAEIRAEFQRLSNERAG